MRDVEVCACMRSMRDMCNLSLPKDYRLKTYLKAIQSNDRIAQEIPRSQFHFFQRFNDKES